MSDCSRAAAEISDVHYRVCVLGGGGGVRGRGEGLFLSWGERFSYRSWPRTIVHLLLQ